jgi:hypothetical protein
MTPGRWRSGAALAYARAMPFHRSIELDVDAPTLYDALREVVLPNVEEGPFWVTVEREDEEFGIGFESRLSSSRYHFEIEEIEEGTRLEARLWIGGVFGPLHTVLRIWSHNRHLDKLLSGIATKAEEIAAADRAAESAADPDPETDA